MAGPVNGTNFMLLEGNTPVGHSTNCSMNLSLDLPEKTTKDSNGWVEVIEGLRSAEMVVDGLTDYTDTLSFEGLVDKIITRAENIYVFNIGDFFYYGNGYIASAEEVAEMEGPVRYNITIKVTKILVSDNQLPWNLIDKLWENVNSQWQAT